ncbi:flagellar basal body rod protein FlgB [Paenibacillus phoenicis]|uniref:Flagellar basal body rod protein FlgB n=2 Tax=Paenibacillus TaxID=44249 RepID=A0ABY1LWQ3_9BACL|nr:MULTISPECIES: flagellar basal body rod protein FlgB [Paenibacillus]EES75048.1 flagellar basal-body rod protein FlgB [Paenibacillus sp. oral taxon 786 str. D14]MCT2196728.1 flagellar basal body rod protein FlgB [Paenibacillus sp. p3-SID1389]MDU0331387.1 flagellar basal body rod protein FlgB [Paenibacillus sp. 3LSP]MEA3569264.1 flagellar basal body rod protein FlgB [Paenibacillus phoenicis]MEC2346056.1 flagellar basal body rod protein FlgB [Paenibacillus barengoltzii]
MQLLNGLGFDRLETAIQAANLRQGVIANNIANVDTPYFKRSSVSFESMLQAEMNGNMPALQGRRTDVRHFVIGPTTEVPEPVVSVDQSTAMNNNQNNVDIDSEMTKLAENQLRYNAYIEQLNYLIKMKRTVVEGR